MIELMVVIVIILILISILMPALARARYTAKLSICQSNLKHIATGLQVYAADADEYYPQRGAIRNGLTDHSNGRYYDIIPLLTTYFDTDLELFTCPLTPAPTTNSYALFFATKGQASGAPIGGLGERIVQYDVNGNMIADETTTPVMFQTWYYQPLGGTLRRVGSSWRDARADRWFDLLASDSLIHYGGHPGYNRRANHHDFNAALQELDVWWGRYVWATEAFSRVYPTMSGYFAGEDGAVTRYFVPNGADASWRDNYHSVLNQIVPLDFERE